jgi:hypothetical protein
MARISSYPYETVVTDNDAWIGTEATKRLSRQFTASAVANYLNLQAKIAIGGQMSFKWTDTQKGGTGTVSKVGGGGSGAAFNTLTEVYLAKNELNSQNVIAFMQYITGKDILIGQGNQISQFGHFKLDTYVVDTDADYYKAGITYLGGNGTIVDNTVYTIIHFDINDAGETYTHTQAVPSASWTVVHNLNKNPSITIVNTSDEVVAGCAEYDSANQITLTFDAPFAGKAYLN